LKRLLILSSGLAIILIILAACGGGSHRIQPGPGPGPEPPPATNEVSGVLTDSYGNPLADATVLVDGVDIGIETDSAGSFTIPSGVVRSNERFSLSLRHEGVMFGERDFDIGDDWSIDWQLGAPDENGGTVNGLVIDADTEEPVAGAVVALFSEDGWASLGITEAAGTYEFTGVPVGDYYLVVFADGYRLQMLSLSVEAGDTTQHVIRLEPRGQRPPSDGYMVSGRVVDADSGAGIGGALVQGNSDCGWYYLLEDEAEPPSMPDDSGMGEGIAYAEPGMPSRDGPDPNWEPPVYQETYTDENGYFDFPDPFNGMGVYLSANQEGYMPFSGFFNREAGIDIEVELELTPIVPVNVSGTVTDTEGSPIEGAYVEFIYMDPNFYGYDYAVPMGADLDDMDAGGLAYAERQYGDAALPGADSPPESGGGYDQSHDSYGMARYRYQQRENRGASQDMPVPFGYYAATTDENGDYDLGEIPSGFYSIFVGAYGYLGYASDSEITEDTDDMDFVLTAIPVGSVRGCVKDEDGNPISDALVNATQPYVDPFTFTDESGEFELVNVPVGDWRVGAYRDGYEARAVTVEISEDVAIELSFTLPLAEAPPPTDLVTFTGAVLDGSTGEALAGSDLVAVATDDSYYTYVQSNESGNYTMLLPAGDYNVLVQHEGYEDLYTRVWVNTEWPEFDFYLWPIGAGGWGPWGGIVDGEVPPPSGAPGEPPRE